MYIFENIRQSYEKRKTIINGNQNANECEIRLSFEKQTSDYLTFIFFHDYTFSVCEEYKKIVEKTSNTQRLK